MNVRVVKVVGRSPVSEFLKNRNITFIKVMKWLAVSCPYIHQIFISIYLYAGLA